MLNILTNILKMRRNYTYQTLFMPKDSKSRAEQDSMRDLLRCGESTTIVASSFGNVISQKAFLDRSVVARGRQGRFSLAYRQIHELLPLQE